MRDLAARIGDALRAGPVHHPAFSKLGKGPVREDPQNLRFARYLEALPASPSKVERANLVPAWPMYGNDRYGDCVFAGAGHETQLWTAMGGNEITLPEQAILDAYSAVTGFTPNDPSTDNGAVVLDALNYRRNTGIAGHKIGAFVQINPRNIAHVRAAIDLFGAIAVGLALPIAAQNQTIWHTARGPNGKPGSWGGHYVPGIGYDSRHLELITWGERKVMTFGALYQWCDECYALLSPEMLQRGLGPHGFNMDQLLSDLSALK